MTSIERISFPIQFPNGHTELARVLRMISERLDGSLKSQHDVSTGSASTRLSSLLEDAACLAKAEAPDDIVFVKTRDGEPTLNDIDQGSTGCFAIRPNGSLAKIYRRLSNYDEMLRNMIASIHKRLEFDILPPALPCDLIFLSEKRPIDLKHLIELRFLDRQSEVRKSSPIYYLSNLHLSKIDHLSTALLESHTTLRRRSLSVKELAMLAVLGVELGKRLTLAETTLAATNTEGKILAESYKQAFSDVIGFLVLSEVWGPQLGYTPNDCCIFYIQEMLSKLCRGNGTEPDLSRTLVQLNYLTHFGALEYSSQGTLLNIQDAQLIVAAMRSFARVLVEALLKSGHQILGAVDAQFGAQSCATAEQARFLDVMKNYTEPLIVYEQEFL